MILSDTTIKKYIESGKIEVKPDFDFQDISPVGIRVYLDKEILIPEPNQYVNLRQPTELKYKRIDIREKGYILKPGEFVLGATFERIRTARNILTMLDGRSTIARLGLTTHITAGVIDGKYDTPKSIVLEIKNVGNFNFHLNYKDPIGMIYFVRLTEPVVHQIEDRYKAQSNGGVMAPNLFHKPLGK
ncbi:MAG: dCTP deaminase [Patescibacteria group bacterium]